MSRIGAAFAGGVNVCAFLDMIPKSELGLALMAKSDDGYNTIVTSTPAHPVLFASYKDHPRRLMTVRDKNGNPVMHDGKPLESTAAGRYQTLEHNFDYYKRLLGLKDFSPVSQDKIAIQQIKEKHAIPAIVAGDFATAIHLCRELWASFPGGSSGQHQNPLSLLEQYYRAAGGKLA